MNIAIILASGMGKRMGKSKNKVLLELKGKPMLAWTLQAFERLKLINEIVVVHRKGEQGFLEKIIAKEKLKKIKSIMTGGKERQDSAFCAVKKLAEKLTKKQKEKALLLFHNGANPFVGKKEISSVIRAAQKFGAAAVAQKTKDTIKEVNDRDIVEKTLDRSRLRNMQTPQAIKFKLAQKVFFQAQKENFLGTDDVSLVERAGGQVKLVPASDFNFKITTPLDLELAKIILNKKLINP